MRRGTFRGSDPRPPQLAVTTWRRPMSGGLRSRCSRASCGRRSAYEAYSSGGPGFGAGGVQRVPCSRPTGTAPGWATHQSATTARDAIPTVTGVAESRRLQNRPGRRAPGGGGGGASSPRPLGASRNWRIAAPWHTRAAGGRGAPHRGVGGHGPRRHSATLPSCRVGGPSRLGVRRTRPHPQRRAGKRGCWYQAGAGSGPVPAPRAG